MKQIRSMTQEHLWDLAIDATQQWVWVQWSNLWMNDWRMTQRMSVGFSKGCYTAINMGQFNEWMSNQGDRSAYATTTISRINFKISTNIYNIYNYEWVNTQTKINLTIKMSILSFNPPKNKFKNNDRTKQISGQINLRIYKKIQG